jgi:Zn-dependent protease
MFRRSGSIKLMEIGGIRIGVDATWFVMLFLLIFLLSGSFRTTLNSSDGVAYLTTVATVLLFFFSLILHELGHAFAARREGITVNGIDLFLFGGVTRMSRDAQNPGEEFRVAIAGPLGTLVFVLICLVADLAIVGPHRLLDAVLLSSSVRLTPVLLGLSWLLPMNVLILVFNLVPAYPLDGGRLLRALVWRRTGSKQRGTQVAAKCGQGFAIILGIVGLWLLIAYKSFTGGWLMVLAFLLGQSARSSLMQSAVTARIEAVRVSDIMDREPVTVSSLTPIGEALDDAFIRYGAVWLPVVDATGHFLGISHRDRVQAATDGGDGWLTMGSVMDNATADSLQVDEDRPLTELLSLEPLGRLGAVMAVDEHGMLRGVVTLDQVRRALRSIFPVSPSEA